MCVCVSTRIGFQFRFNFRNRITRRQMRLKCQLEGEIRLNSERYIYRNLSLGIFVKWLANMWNDLDMSKQLGYGLGQFASTRFL